MPKMKIGESITSKLEDLKPYYTIGIAKTDKGYEVRRIRVFGTEVEVRKVFLTTTERGEAMHEMRLRVSDYIINFNEEEMK